MPIDTSKTEYGWLIEHCGEPGPHGPAYWVPRPSILRVMPWTFDNLEAVRFARREDAQAVADTLHGGPHRVVEHGWG